VGISIENIEGAGWIKLQLGLQAFINALLIKNNPLKPNK
jgi:hypothetical protein